MTEAHDATAAAPAGPPEPDPAERPALTRSRRSHVVAGVCGGLGRFFGVDPVIFRVVVAVLTVTGGLGLVGYGIAWLVMPLEGDEDNEAKRLLTGRIEGSTLAAVLLALVGCALFLSMVDNGGTLTFTVLVIAAVGAAAHRARRRRDAPGPDAEPFRAVVPPRTEAPPETQAPPAPGVVSWWRDPLVKDGTTGPPGSGQGYLWGPDPEAHTAAEPSAAHPPARQDAGGKGCEPAGRGQGIGGRTFVLALLAGAVGTAAAWHGNPLGQALQTGLAAALGVFGTGLAVSAFRGRTGFGTLLLSVLTAALLMGATVLPREIGTDWRSTVWRPASVAEVRPGYTAGTGLATLDLSRLDVPKGTTVTVRAAMDAGRLRVVLPPEAAATGAVEIRLGDLMLPGERRDHVRVQNDRTHRPELAPAPGAVPGGTIDLQLRMAVGQVEVTRAAS
ncbi:PspC domain-containing protein [Streptomyces bambusae]|uniref:PspC domain-containing protein n=1 Tax=Streptomyces bambusae TaxID=1550616 RepID=UPI001CFDF966|nr:PspC domain-containing protein [Streptomyces bambusae]MCB5165881.1 PspC domain-containing protein [Streptomyces bambusae]